jgi:4-hydroxy-2-oxoheptanedioate aldolase
LQCVRVAERRVILKADPRARHHSVIAGIHNGTPEAALRRIKKGFQFVTVSSDARLMAAGAQQVIAKMRAR